MPSTRIHLTFDLEVGTSIPWTNCSTWTDQMDIHTVDANRWPPARNELLMVSVNGIARESFIHGEYRKTLAYRGYALPSIFGSLTDLGVQLPSHPGPLKWIIWNTTIPEVAPTGNYELTIRASEQDEAEIFCITVAFEL